MRPIEIDPSALKKVFNAVARGETLKGAVARLLPGKKYRTVQQRIYDLYSEEYAKVLFRRSERQRKTKLSRKHRSDNLYATSPRGKAMRLARVRGYRKNPRFRLWEQMCCKSYRAGKLLGMTGAEVRKMWFPHLLSFRWFGVSYEVNEMTPGELQKSEAAELPPPPHTHLPHIAARSPCDA